MPLAVRGRSPTGRLERSWGLWQEVYSARGQVYICSFVLLTLLKEWEGIRGRYPFLSFAGWVKRPNA